MTKAPHRVLLHLADGLRRAVDPDEVYLLEASQGGTRVRRRSARALMDVRDLGEIAPFFEPHGFLRIHREFCVNLGLIREIRRRERGRDWQVRLEPPVNRVLPVSRSALSALWRAFVV